MKLAILFICLGIILTLRCFLYFRDQPQYRNGQELSFVATLQEQPPLSNKGQQFSLNTSTNQTIFIKAGSSPLYAFGDRLRIAGILQESKSERGNTFLMMYFPKIVVVKEPENTVIAASKLIRQHGSRLFHQTLPPVASGLLSGIIFGSKEQFSDSFMDSLRNVGVLHVIAASGMNVSFVAGAILFSLGTFLSRRLSLCLAIFAVIFYSFMVGFQPSIIRASIMAMIALSASFFGRQSLAVLSVFTSALFMLLWQPNYLFDVGFQLSFFATLGILLLKPLFPGWLSILGEDVSTTISAELATAPILLSVFGQYGLLSLLVNGLVLWTVPILMVLGSLAVILSFLMPPLATVLVVLCLPFLWFFEQVVSFFGSLGWDLHVAAFPAGLVIGYYFMLLAVVMFLKKQTIKAKKCHPELVSGSLLQKK